MNQIVELLKASRADAWELTDTKTEGWEFYFIRHELDQNRLRHVEHVQVTVYVSMNDGASYGIASGELHPTWSVDQKAAFIDQLCDTAQYGENRVFELHEPKEVRTEAVNINPRDNAAQFIETMKSVHETETEFINSYEIFTDVSTTRFLNSNGIDITETVPSSMVEVVVNARDAEHEIELYRMYRGGSCNSAYLKQEIENTMRYGHDRLSAVDTPVNLNVPVVFTTDAACAIYDYFLARIDGAYIYRGMSQAKEGEALIEDRQEYPLTIRAVRNLPNSSANHVMDQEGGLIEDRVLIDHNMTASITGSRRFAWYLGKKDSFIVSNYEVEPSDVCEDDILKGSYLEVVEFSGFQVSPMTGDIFGEIRLGYLHDDNGITVVKGGSISGNIRNQLKDMLFSDTLKQYNNKSIPAVTCMKHLTIAGCAKN
ncbi:MAG: metallopeptidase TldD-related protein [Bulleidia sp.]